MKKYPHFFFRTVKNGKIKFDGRLWETKTSTERLDGKRFAFGTYPDYRTGKGILDLLCLWGTEEAYRAIGMTCDDDKLIAKYWESDNQILAPDGYLREYWWHSVKK